MDLPFNPAADRNKDPIFEKLKEVFAETKRVLEIGGGTGQHAVFFASNMPHLHWQSSELPGNLEDLTRQLTASGLPNLAAPIELDVAAEAWPAPMKNAPNAFDGIYTSNTLHIMSQDHVRAFFQHVGKCLAASGTLAVYGPFKYDGAFNTPSNEAFDAQLKQMYPASGLRDFEWVNHQAELQGLSLVADHDLPANNQLLVWKRN